MSEKLKTMPMAWAESIKKFLASVATATPDGRGGRAVDSGAYEQTVEKGAGELEAQQRAIADALLVFVATLEAQDTSAAGQIAACLFELRTALERLQHDPYPAFVELAAGLFTRFGSDPDVRYWWLRGEAEHRPNEAKATALLEQLGDIRRLDERSAWVAIRLLPLLSLETRREVWVALVDGLDEARIASYLPWTLLSHVRSDFRGETYAHGEPVNATDPRVLRALVRLTTLGAGDEALREALTTMMRMFVQNIGGFTKAVATEVLSTSDEVLAIVTAAEPTSHEGGRLKEELARARADMQATERRRRYSAEVPEGTCVKLGKLGKGRRVLGVVPVREGWVVSTTAPRDIMAVSLVPRLGASAARAAFKVVRSPDEPIIPEMPYLVVDPSGKFVVSNVGCNGHIWELPSCKLVRRVAELGDFDEPLGWTADGSSLVLAEADANHICRVRILNPQTGVLRTLFEASRGIMATALTEHHVLVGVREGTIVHDLRTGTSTTWPVKSEQIWPLGSDAVLIAVEREGESLALQRWELATGRLQTELSAELSVGAWWAGLSARGSGSIVFASTTHYVTVDLSSGAAVAEGELHAAEPPIRIRDKLYFNDGVGHTIAVDWRTGRMAMRWPHAGVLATVAETGEVVVGDQRGVLWSLTPDSPETARNQTSTTA